jgi:hypothetical protein
MSNSFLIRAWPQARVGQSFLQLLDAPIPVANVCIDCHNEGGFGAR